MLSGDGKSTSSLRFCARHRSQGHVDVSHRRHACRVQGCSARASYARPPAAKSVQSGGEAAPDSVQSGGEAAPDSLPQARSALRCAAHKLPGDVDVLHRRCAAAGCFKVPLPAHALLFRKASSIPQGFHHSFFCRMPGVPSHVFMLECFKGTMRRWQSPGHPWECCFWSRLAQN